MFASACRKSSESPANRSLTELTTPTRQHHYSSSGPWRDSLALPLHADRWLSPIPSAKGSEDGKSAIEVHSRGYLAQAAAKSVRHYAGDKPWIWPNETLFFFSDLHADADAWIHSLLTAGAIVAPHSLDRNHDLQLTHCGSQARIIVGGDCFDKGPSNLKLLRSISRLRSAGAKIELLAGNHDLRTFVGLAYLGRKESRFAHLFTRMGKKAVPLFKEIWDTYLAHSNLSIDISNAELERELFPPDSWWETFPASVADLLPQPAIDKELRRIREKVREFHVRAQENGLSLQQIYLASKKFIELFLEPSGEFFWFFETMKLATRYGSLLFVHAGMCDESAETLYRGGVDALNREFKELMNNDPFSLYHGPLGNCVRTKYGATDRPLSSHGVELLHRSGIYAIVHGHRNSHCGQRLVLRDNLLNFECDASLDRNTRRNEGLAGAGAAVTIFQPNATVLGISTDWPHAKYFQLCEYAKLVTLMPSS